MVWLLKFYNEATVYAKLAKRFLEDKDSKEGKALHYYLSLTK